jgi:molybdenum cofactor synthesis domain-containing protein
MTQPTLVTAALLIIGNEILSGRTQDKNLAYLATELNRAGIQLREVRVVPDVEAEIIAAVNALRARYDYLFTTGGIGPTHDDITSASIARAFGVKLIRHPEAEAALRAHYTPDMINEARLKMADVPEGSTLIPNIVSAAPGFRVENVFILAGVPKIMQAMLAAAIPHLEGGAVVQSVNITTNLPEGTIAAGLTEIQSRYTDLDIGSYPYYKEGDRSTTLVFRGVDAARANAARGETEALILGLGGKVIPAPQA